MIQRSSMKYQFLAIFLTAAFLLLTVPSLSFAADSTTDETEMVTPVTTITLSTTPAATATPSMKHVEYDLPYPGLLPDNPLYNIKALRDKIIEILISDPAKKGEFYLLSSDKRFNTGYMLVLKGKNDLGTLYISKSNNYMNMAITQSTLAGAAGKQDLQKMKIAIKKHEELTTDLLGKVDKKNKTNLLYEIDRLSKFATLLKNK